MNLQRYVSVTIIYESQTEVPSSLSVFLLLLTPPQQHCSMFTARRRRISTPAKLARDARNRLDGVEEILALSWVDEKGVGLRGDVLRRNSESIEATSLRCLNFIRERVNANLQRYVSVAVTPTAKLTYCRRFACSSPVYVSIISRRRNCSSLASRRCTSVRKTGACSQKVRSTWKRSQLSVLSKMNKAT
jgi:hypothetical protein